MVNGDVFREDILAELFVEEITVDLEASEDALKKAHNLTMYLSDVLAASASNLPSGDQRDRVLDAQSSTLRLMCEVGDALRGVRVSPR